MNMPTFGNSAASPSPFAGLDEASVGTPKLQAGDSLIEIVKCEYDDGQFGLSFHAHVRVLESTNPLNQAGKVYRWTRGGLTKNQYQEGNMARLKEFLAACFSVSPAEPPGPDQSWLDVVTLAVQGEGVALAGCRVVLKGEDKKSAGNGNAYVKWKAFPAPAAA